MYLALDSCLYPLFYIFKNYDILPSVMTSACNLRIWTTKTGWAKWVWDHKVNFMPQSEIQWALLKKNKDQTKKLYHSVVITEIFLYNSSDIRNKKELKQKKNHDFIYISI